MIPKSTANLSAGDYCLVPRRDGKFVPFVFIEKRGNARSYFFGALADTILPTPSSTLPSRLRLLQHALLHIKFYSENQFSIVGNLLPCLDLNALKTIQADVAASGVGHTTYVWGYRTPVKYANDIRSSKGRVG